MITAPSHAYQAAISALQAGLSTIPPRMDGTKRPLAAWKQYQDATPTESDLAGWYRNGQTGVGLVCGDVSGGLECLDFDNRDAWADYKKAAKSSGLGDLLKRVAYGYSEETPNGFHLLLRCSEISGNTKLANAEDKKALIETRGEGGFIIVAPSHGKVNPAGDYVLKAGGFDSIVTITPGEREQLHRLARTFDKIPIKAPPKAPAKQHAGNDGNRPGDEFNRSKTWPEILEPHGWVRVFERGGTTHWRRPGKSEGISATTNHEGSDLLWVFITSTVLESERSYDRFGAHVLLNHGGDFAVAVRALGGTYTANTREPEQWPEPGVISNPLLPVEALPDALIPEPFRAWIKDISRRMQTPPDFAAVTAITVTASLIGTACTIKPKQKDDWIVVPNLWGACIGRPSVVLKSPSMKEAMNMLGRLQTKAREIYDAEKQGHQFDLKVQEKQEKELDAAIKKAVKNKNSNELATLREKYKADDELQPPVCRLFKTNETSIQSQTVLQKQNPRGLLTFRDEIMGLLTRWDKRDHEDERAYFLEGWNGDGSYTDFKIGRGLTDADNICISLFGGIQPDKLRRYLHQSMTGGNDGLMQRFQLAVYPDEPTAWQLVDEYPDTKEKTRVFDILNLLADADFTQHGAKQSEYDKFSYMHFTDEGQQVFNGWLTDLQHELPGEDNPLMAEHLGKYRSLMPTLALIFHLISIADDTASGQVSEQAATMAAGWCEYLESHARRIYGYAASPEREAAVILSERITRLPNPFTAKQVYDKGWHLLKNRQEVEAACDVLEGEGWLSAEHPETTGKAGRPALPRYFINLALLVEK
jgi:hypothetical protein